MNVDTRANTVHNPIISGLSSRAYGFNPDPSCIYVNGTFYLVTSTFLYFPGIPVYSSKDLKTWTQIGNVISRSSQLDLSKCRLRPGTQFSGGIWAPTIRYRDGVFYVITTCVFTEKNWDDYSRWQNVIYSCTDPLANDWSDPVFFDFPGYDTSLFWDDDGKVYMQGSFYWRIRPEIQQFEIDLKTGKSLSGEPKALWPGTGGMAPEAPHMYKKGETYYLLIAEGGTEFGHMATLATAPTVWGPFTSCPANPILTAPSKASLFQTIGHADLFQDASGQWWSCALATRVVGDSFPIGRESTLVPVDWSGDWPKPDLRPLDVSPDTVRPKESVAEEGWRDVLRPPRFHLLHLRNPDPSRYTITDTSVVLRPSQVPLSAPLGSPTFLAVRQRDLYFECEATFTLPSTPGVQTGLAVLNDHERFFAATIGVATAKLASGAATAAGASPPPAVSLDSAWDVTLRIRGTPTMYTFEFTAKDGAPAWQHLGEGACKDINGGFMGAVLALFAVGEEEATEAPVTVRGWHYRAL